MVEVSVAELKQKFELVLASYSNHRITLTNPEEESLITACDMLHDCQVYLVRALTPASIRTLVVTFAPYSGRQDKIVYFRILFNEIIRLLTEVQQTDIKLKTLLNDILDTCAEYFRESLIIK